MDNQLALMIIGVIIALSNIIIIILLTRIIEQIKNNKGNNQYLKPNQNSQNSQLQSTQVVHNQEMFKEEKTPVQVVAEDKIIQPSIKEKTMHLQSEEPKNITETEQKEVKQNIDQEAMKPSSGDIGMVFCRKCDQPYLSNENSCPKCNTSR
jgi:hypothetical protein